MSGSSYSEDVFNIYTVFPLVWALFPGEANDHYLWQKYKEDFVWFSLTHCSGGCWARLIGWNWVSPCYRAGGGSSLLESHEVGFPEEKSSLGPERVGETNSTHAHYVHLLSLYVCLSFGAIEIVEIHCLFYVLAFLSVPRNVGFGRT